MLFKNIQNFDERDKLHYVTVYLSGEKNHFNMKLGWCDSLKFLASKAVVEINFFDNLPVGQVSLNVYLPEKISTCPKKNVLLSFEVNLEKSTEFAKFA